MMGAPSRILVIKLGALGDVVQALGPMAAIRRVHGDARITVLTTAPFADLLRASPSLDEVWIDDRVPLWRPDRVLAMRQRLRAGHFEVVYDLQTSDRSSAYFRLMGWPRPLWSGIARGCSHRHADPARDAMHTIDRQRAQLAVAGVHDVPAPDLTWATADLARFALPNRYAAIAPGGAPHRTAKRWPAGCFGALACALAERGLAPVLIGTRAETEALARVKATCPAVFDLGGATSLIELAALLRGATVFIGNDSGPAHMAAVAGCPTVVLFSVASDPALTAPRGANVTVLRAEPLASLPVEAIVRVFPANFRDAPFPGAPSDEG